MSLDTAQHDGAGNSCNYSDRYIMASSNSAFTNATRLNPWRFSNCSIQYIKRYTDDLMKTSSGATCLTDRKSVTPGLPDVSQRLPGLNVSINDQCRMIYGNQSVACLNFVPSSSSICYTMYCYKPDGFCYGLSGALAGTTCGSGKLCLKGDCVDNPRAPVADDACLFGDDLSYTINNMTCHVMALTQTWLCYYADVRQRCCASCKSIYRPYQDCEYGDHVTWCTTGHCPDNLIDCCRTCNYSVPIKTSSTTAAIKSSSSLSSSTASNVMFTRSSSSSASSSATSVQPASSAITKTSPSDIINTSQATLRKGPSSSSSTTIQSLLLLLFTVVLVPYI